MVLLSEKGLMIFMPLPIPIGQGIALTEDLLLAFVYILAPILSLGSLKSNPQSLDLHKG